MNAPKPPKTKARLEQLITQWQKDSGQPVARLNLRVQLLGPPLARSPVPERHDDDQQDVVLDCVDDAVVADAHAHAGSPAERPCRRWARILGEESDGALDATSDGRVELPERTESSRAQLDAVGHAQPRSALA